MKKLHTLFEGLHSFLILWATQSLSTLGSSMTNFALIVWSYQQKGSALTTALLSICSYTPYVILSIFAGALSDKWDKKKTMLVSDSLAALGTLVVLVLLKTDRLEIWHLYLLNALSGIMNTFQQPASDVAVSLLTPENQYQRASGLRSLSNSLVTILTPALAASVLAFGGMDAVIAIDLGTFLLAFVTLKWWIHIPKVQTTAKKEEPLLTAAKKGLLFLREHREILDLILFLAAINLTASMYEAALPAMLLSRSGGGKTVYGLVNTCMGAANLAGSLLASLLPSPKRRMKVIYASLFFSMSTENFLLAFGRSAPVWCLGAVLGWLFIPLMSANMDVLLRSNIPIDMQGRIYAARNSLQFFTIPVGYLLGGVLVDEVFEPFMRAQSSNSVFIKIFGSGKGTGAAFLFLILAFLGIATCFVFLGDSHLRKLDETKSE